MGGLEDFSRIAMDALQAEKEAIARLDKLSADISGCLEESASGKISFNHAKYVMAKKLAEIDASKLYKAKGYGNVSAWAEKEFNLFHLKEQSIREMVNVGRKPHILALEHRGVKFSCANRLASLRADQLPLNPETMTQHECNAYVKQIREAEKARKNGQDDVVTNIADIIGTLI